MKDDLSPLLTWICTLILGFCIGWIMRTPATDGCPCPCQTAALPAEKEARP